MSPELSRFYKELQEWLDKGLPQFEPFNRGYGLCLNLDMWSNFKPSLREELKQHFSNAGLDRYYPFNIGEGSFLREILEEKLWQNQKRLEWVRSHANF